MRNLATARPTKDWRNRVAIRVVELGEILDIGRNSAYDAVRSGHIPSIRVGKRILVPVAALKKILGEAA